MRGAYLYCSGWYGQDFDKTIATAAGFDYHFVKPANAGELARILANIES